MGVEAILGLIVGTAALTSIITFLPAIIELRYPKDAGPRFISGCEEARNLSRVVNIDAWATNKLVSLPTGFLDMLPSLETESI